MNILESSKVGQIVAEDYRTAAIFNKYHIDFCCNGGVSLHQACEKHNLSFENLVKDLSSVVADQSNVFVDFDTWKAEDLISYITENHHKFVREKTPVILQFLYKLCKVHGQRHPELFTITRIFEESARDMDHHMMKEEKVLFPYILKMSASSDLNTPFEAAPFQTVQNPLSVLMSEHENEGDRFREISELSNQYTTPSDGCTTYKVALEMLKEFEEDLHLHIHLENNILFPKSVQMESTLLNPENRM